MAWNHKTQWQVFDESGRRKYVNDDERRSFLAEADKLSQGDRALCYTLTIAGCRISEALNLHRYHLETVRQVIVFRTLKRRSTVFRVVPISPKLARMLSVLPCDTEGRYWTMHRTTAWHIVKEAMRKAGVYGPMASCKGLRHGFGIRAAARGIPPNLIQRWLGHSDSSTTAIYLDAVGLEEKRFAERMWA